MIRCDGGMSNDFSKRNGPCIVLGRRRSLHASWFAGSWRPADHPAITHLQPTDTGMPGILSKLCTWLARLPMA